MKCDKLKAYKVYTTRNEGAFGFCEGADPTDIELEHESVCLKSDVDKEIAELKDKCQMHDFFWEGCGFEKRGFKNTIAVAQYVEDLEAKLRATRRALWLARAERAKEMAKGYNAVVEWCSHSRWIEVKRKCLKKAEESK